MFEMIKANDPEALRRSLDRGQTVLNCYTWLLQAIPNPDMSVAYSEARQLKAKLNDWKGDWSMFHDYTPEIVPYETAFVRNRKFYAKKGIGLSKVPYLVQKDNTMLLPEIISDAEAKARFNPSAISTPAPEKPKINPILLGLGVVLALGVFSLARKGRGLSGTQIQHAQSLWRLGERLREAEKARDDVEVVRIGAMIERELSWSSQRARRAFLSTLPPDLVDSLGLGRKDFSGCIRDLKGVCSKYER